MDTIWRRNLPAMILASSIDKCLDEGFARTEKATASAEVSAEASKVLFSFDSPWSDRVMSTPNPAIIHYDCTFVHRSAIILLERGRNIAVVKR